MPRPIAVIRSASLSGYLDLARRHGLDPVRMMSKAGLSVRCLDDPETPISVHAVRQLLEDSAQAAGVEDFGLQMAKGRRLANLGPIGLVLRDEPTARQALDTLSRFLRLLNTSLLTHMEDQGDSVIIREQIVLDSVGSIRQSMELAVGVMYRILVELLGAQWRPRKVCFTHRQPGDLAAHRAMFGNVLEFNSDFDGIVCAASDLQAPLPHEASGISSLARRFLDQALSRSGRQAVATTRQLISALLPGGRCTAEQVAQHMGIDRRTLHRHLAMEGETFSALVAAIRAEFAQRQIRDSDRTSAELAQLLGFSGASAFAYWFRCRFQCTVSQMRAMRGPLTGVLMYPSTPETPPSPSQRPASGRPKVGAGAT